MKISEERLKEIIKEEIDTAVEEGLFDRVKSLGSRAGSKVAGAFGADTASREMAAKADSLKAKDAAEKAAKKREKTLARKRKTQTYPATELGTLISMIQKASRQSGVKFKGKRGALVDEFEKILYSGGFRLDEQRNRLFIGKDGNIAINPADAPVLTNFLTTLKAQSPDVFKQLAKQMNNYRFDLPDDLGSEAEEEIPPITTVATIDPDAPDIPPGEVHMDLSDEEPEAPAAEEETVAIYKGKGGVSLQSFIDRLGGDDPEIKGVVRSTILKHIANQMKKQGVKIVEEEQALTAYNMIAEEFLSSLDEAAVAIYSHPAGKEHSLNAALQKLRADGATGIEKEKLGKLLNALARWAKSQGLKVNEEIENSVTNQLDARSQTLRESVETSRWKVLSGIK